MRISRDLLSTIKIFIKRKEFLAIIGPRQAGKTTLLEIIEHYLTAEKKIQSNCIQKVTFEDKNYLRQFSADPVNFVRSFFSIQTSGKKYLMIDEFQYAKSGGQKLKLVYDTVENIKIIITGSSSLDLKAQVGKYLVGRILTFHLYPFNFKESLDYEDKRLKEHYENRHGQFMKFLYQDKKLSFLKHSDIDPFAEVMTKFYEKFCIWGGYPAVVLSRTEIEKRKLLKDIYNNYILNDIKGLLELATEENLFKLSQYLATQTGNLITYQNLSIISSLDFRNLKKHLKILQETFVCYQAKPFFKNKQKELSKNPKIYFLDLGFRNNLMENFNNLEKRSDSGAIVENAVFIRLRELFEDRGVINFWRTKAGAEVDFVIQHQGEIIPIEVKYSHFNKPKIERSLDSFLHAFSPKKALVLTKNYFARIKRAGTEVIFYPVYYL